VPLALTPGRIAAAVLVAASLAATVWLSFTHDVLPSMIPNTDMHELHVDFDTFWQSAVALTHGADIYDTPAKLTNLNPPLMTVLLAPFALLDALVAYRVWVVLAALLVIGSLLLVGRELRLRPAVTVLAVLAVLASSPLHGTLVLGQIYPVLLAGIVAGWLAERHDRPVLAAVLYGVVVALKPSLAPLLLIPAVQRRWAPLRAGIASAAVATLAGVAVCGPRSGLDWVGIALHEPVPDTVDNASLPGLFVREGLPATIGTVLGLVVLAGTLAWVARHRDRLHPGGTLPFAVLAAGLLLSPIAWHNYLLLLFPGVFVLCTRGWGAGAAVMLAVAVLPVSWNAPDAPGSLIDGSTYFLILVAYWVVLVRAAPLTGPSSVAAEEPETAGATADG